MEFLGIFISIVRPFWVLGLLIIIISILKLFIPSFKGKTGEGLVNLAAKLRLDSNTYRLIKDVTLPTSRGTTQIDHVIVSKFGIFVIETKNYKGWIFADANQPKWTQVNFKQKHRFQNPLRQNYAHICALSERLDLPKEKIHGVVCFMGDAEFKNGVPKGVFIQGSYINYIKSFRLNVFTENEVNTLVSRIESIRLERGFKTNRAHVQQIKSRLNASTGDGNICPKCGASMVVRTAKRGVNAGNKFWGCSNYPSCRSTKPIAK